jgi:serine protease Do
MLDHMRRIALVFAIFILAGLLYRSWRGNQSGYGLFDLLEGKPMPVGVAAPVSTGRLTEADVPGLARFSEESAKLAAAVLPSVVSINTAAVSPVEVRVGILRGLQYKLSPVLGSGVIVSSDGLILTNYHVVKDAAAEIRVTTQDGKSYTAKVLGADPGLDIAVIRMAGGKDDFPSLAFANSDAVKTGQVVFAVGNPFGLSGTVTQGIISATQRHLSDSVADLLQTDTVINPGSSGGPLVNVKGEIVGINVAIYKGDKEGGTWLGIGLAIPSNDAKEVLQALTEQGMPPKGFLGIEVESELVRINSTLGASMAGAVVSVVVPKSPADLAGLRKGDVIVQFGGVSFADLSHLMRMIRKTKPGQQMPLSVVRDGQLLTLTALIQPQAVDLQPKTHGK